MFNTETFYLTFFPWHSIWHLEKRRKELWYKLETLTKQVGNKIKTMVPVHVMHSCLICCFQLIPSETTPGLVLGVNHQRKAPTLSHQHLIADTMGYPNGDASTGVTAMEDSWDVNQPHDLWVCLGKIMIHNRKNRWTINFQPNLCRNHKIRAGHWTH